MHTYLTKLITPLLLASLALACSDTTLPDQQREESPQLCITSSVEPYQDDVSGTRVCAAGDSFKDGDFIMIKIICPFVPSVEIGESTGGGSNDAFFLLKRKGDSWVNLTTADGFDVNGDYSPGYSPDIYGGGYTEVQQTPYIYTAVTWSEEKLFIAKNQLLDQFTNVFHADQRLERDYCASDILWAQTVMQTGAWNIHLSFQHKMACLDITVDDSNMRDAEGNAVTLSNNAVLTLEGMPDIDRAEVCVGNYYANRSKVNSPFGYQQKTVCSYDNNGKVIGIAVIDEADGKAVAYPMTGNPNPAGGWAYNKTELTPIPNTGTYTAYKYGDKHFRLIVPPCILTDNPTFWLRDGDRRYSIQLDRTTFEEGKLYPVILSIPSNSLPDIPAI